MTMAVPLQEATVIVLADRILRLGRAARLLRFEGPPVQLRSYRDPSYVLWPGSKNASATVRACFSPQHYNGPYEGDTLIAVRRQNDQVVREHSWIDDRTQLFDLQGGHRHRIAAKIIAEPLRSAQQLFDAVRLLELLAAYCAEWRRPHVTKVNVARLSISLENMLYSCRQHIASPDASFPSTPRAIGQWLRAEAALIALAGR